MKIVPTGPTIADLEKKASEYEQQANSEPEQVARLLLEKAGACRDWIAALKSGSWTS